MQALSPTPGNGTTECQYKEPLHINKILYISFRETMTITYCELQGGYSAGHWHLWVTVRNVPLYDSRWNRLETQHVAAHRISYLGVL